MTPYDLYHVTYQRNLGNIAASGLRRGHSHREGWQAQHSQGWVFLTEFDGIGFWYENMRRWANHNSDNPFEDGLTPVVVRVWGVLDDEVVLDAEGTRDAGGSEAYMLGRDIEPHDVEMWDGSEWVTPSSDGIDAEQAWEEEEVDGEVLYYERSSPLEEPEE